MKRLFTFCFMMLTATAPVLAEAPWTKIEMKDFTLVGTASEKDILSVGNKLEQFRQALAFLLPQAKLESSIPTTIYVFGSYDDFESYFNRTKFPQRPAGVFIPTPEGNYIDLSAERKSPESDQVIFHEYFHYVMGRNLLRVPAWLNEGIADYYSTFDVDSGGMKIRLGAPIAGRLAELRRREFIPLDRLFAVTTASPEYRERDKVGVFYAESWALVHFFLNNNNGERQDQFYKFINLVNKGVAAKTAFTQATGGDYKKIENELQNYINHFSFQVAIYNLDAKIDWEKTAKVTKMSDAEAKVKQANLLRLIGTPEDAETKLTQAIGLDPNLPEAYRLLGNVYEAEKKLPEARQNYEKALALDSNNDLNYYYLAHFLATDKNYDAAIKYYQEAIKLKPDTPRTYAMLGFLYEAMGKTDEAIQQYTQALKLNPGFPPNYFNLAKIAFKINRNDLAQSSAESVIAMDGWASSYSPRAMMILFFTYQKEHKETDAAAILKLGMESTRKENFYYSVMRYLNKEIDDKELFSSAKDNNDKTIADAYIGLNLMLQGKEPEAKEKFQWVKENGSPAFTEYDYAVSNLK